MNNMNGTTANEIGGYKVNSNRRMGFQRQNCVIRRDGILSIKFLLLYRIELIYISKILHRPKPRM
jgi:hypothetical protein